MCKKVRGTWESIIYWLIIIYNIIFLIIIITHLLQQQYNSKICLVAEKNKNI